MLSKRDCWLTECADDVIEIMQQKEKRMYQIQGRSPQLGNREELVNWIISAGKELKLRKTVVFLSVHLLDCFMDCHDLRDQHLTFIAASCLLIAGKFEDNESYAPRISKLNDLIPKFSYTIKEFVRMELTILKFIDWRIMVPTVPHYIEYFSTAATCNHDSKLGNGRNLISNKSISRSIEYFMHHTLHDLVYTRFPPSLIAASCIASMRISLMLSPKWTVNLEKITRYSWIEIQTCVETMMRTVDYDGQMTG